MSSKEAYKLILLGSSFVACTMTYFLPYNSIHGPPLKSLTIHPAQNSKFCNTFRLKFEEQCHDNSNDSNCDTIREEISDCLSIVKAAYDEINYVCLKRNAVYKTCTMACEDESSEDGDSNSKDHSECQTMCDDKKNDFLDCEERIVQKRLQREGIDDWHTGA